MAPCCKQLQAVPVERAEGLEFLAALAEVDAAVVEHTVDIEDRGPDALRLQQQRRREAQRRRVGAPGAIDIR